MDLLLDTHTLIWFLNGDQRLSDKAKSAIEDDNSRNYISLASVWEIAIKLSLGKLKFPEGIENLLKLIQDNGFEILPITTDHTIIVAGLEFIHRDPFDRILVAQSKYSNIPIVTMDGNIKMYNISTVW